MLHSAPGVGTEAVVHLRVRLPRGMSPRRLLDLLEQHGVEVCAGAEPPAPGGGISLSPAEREVLRAFTRCDRSEEIAAQLHCSVETVRSHIKSVYRKLGARSRAVAVGQALRWGLLALEDFLPRADG